MSGNNTTHTARHSAQGPCKAWRRPVMEAAPRRNARGGGRPKGPRIPRLWQTPAAAATPSAGIVVGVPKVQTGNKSRPARSRPN
jgi:hypothetical protein